MKIGLDIVDIDRIKKLIIKNTFFNKILNDDEILLYKDARAETIAGIFATKEAFLKAIGTGIDAYGFKDISVLKNESGKPFLKLSNRVLEEFDIISSDVSISHEKNIAASVVILMYKKLK